MKNAVTGLNCRCPYRKNLSRLGVVGAVCALTTLSSAAPTGKIIFESAQGYTLVPPAEMHRVDAKQADADSDAEFLEGQDDDDNGTRLSIMVQPDPTPVTLEESVRIMRATLEDGMKEEHYKVVGQDTTMLDGTKALTLTASLDADDDDDPKTPSISYRNVTIFALHGGKFYVFNYASPASRFAQTKKSLDASLASLRWTK